MNKSVAENQRQRSGKLDSPFFVTKAISTDYKEHKFDINLRRRISIYTLFQGLRTYYFYEGH